MAQEWAGSAPRASCGAEVAEGRRLDLKPGGRFDQICRSCRQDSTSPTTLAA